MTEYAFPRDLLDAIKTRWKTVPELQFELPEDRILQKLLETCYHASFRTSEQRVVQCVVAYASIADIPEGALRLSRPVVLTDSELVRLSPVTQHRQTVIGCEQMDGWLHIWGFFDYGHAWVQHSAGDPPAVPIQLADFPADCLTITIEGPGALTISQGRTGLVRLRDGRVIFPQEDPDAGLERCRIELELHQMSRKLIRGISQISLLASADGAVLLDDQLRIQGFGVRFPVLLPPGTKVMDALTGDEYLCDQWGLRHQSVFSVCQKCEQAIGLIVSQDGEVKAVKADDGRLMFWDGILD